MDNEYPQRLSNKQDLHTYSEPVLGRTVFLGCLFDAKKNEILPGDSFWKRETIAKNKIQSASFSSILYFFAAQSTFDRFSHMDFDASLKLEFLGGLISVEGSASYLKDSVESENTVAVVMKAHYNTRSETLPTATIKDYEDLCNLKGPTHVVTSINYGMDAHFVFKKTKRTDESKERVSGSLKIAVKSIPSIKIEGEAKVNISGSLKEITKNVEVKLFGDFVLDKQPTTYGESILVYKTLPSHLGEKPDYLNAVKMKMQLTPITRFCDKKDAILVSISHNLLHSVTVMLDKIENTNLKAKTLAMADCVNNYLPLKKIMDTFINKLNIFQLKLKGNLQTLLPSIRGGAASSGEKGLVELLTEYTNSPFNYDTADNFLKTRKREIEMINYILEPAKFKGTNIQILNYEEASDDKILFEKQFVVMMKFNLLPSQHIVDEFLNGKVVNESTSWFNSPEVVATMGREFKSFIQFASVNMNSKNRGYLVAMYNAKKQFLNIYAQKNGKVLSSNFVFPRHPPKMVTFSNTYNSIVFVIRKPLDIWVKYFQVKYWKYGMEGGAIEKTFPFTNEDTTTYEVTELSPNEIYQFSMRYVTEMGTSPSGPESSPVVTRPCSVPTNLRVKDVSATSVSISWDPPLHYGSGVHVVNYAVTVNGGNILGRKAIVGERYAVFEGLDSATAFNVSVQANVNAPKYNRTEQYKELTAVSLLSWLHVVTRPGAPSTPNLVGISYHSAEINWKPPSKVAIGATVVEYLVKYTMLNNLGNKTTIGSSMVQSSRKNTFISIKNLIQGTTYGISIKVVTSLGGSSYSPMLIVKTRFKQTELDSLRNSVEQEIIHSVSKSSTKIYEKIRGDMQAESRRVKDTFKNRSKEVNDQFRNIISDTKAESIRVTQVKANVQNLLRYMADLPRGLFFYPEGTTHHPAYKYYPGYKARFIGFGNRAYQTSYHWIDGFKTVEECVRGCAVFRITHPLYNGLFYNMESTTPCCCIENDKGHRQDGIYLHYIYD